MENRNKGFIQTIILIIIVLAALSYFGFDFKGFFAKPEFANAIATVKNIFAQIWNFLLAFFKSAFAWIMNLSKNIPNTTSASTKP